jgi:hypothetical protein
MKSDLILKLVEMLIDSDKTDSVWTTQSVPVELIETNEQYPIWKKIILRGADCGNLYGTLVSVTKWVYRMKDFRRLWYWKCKTWFTLEDVANYGLHTDSKVTSVVALADVTDPRVSLLLPCSKEAIKNIEALPDYQPS